jgi:predicted dehydrogenase
LNLVDAACVVVPTCYHYDVAKEFLKRGIPVLVEKPLALTLPEAEALVDLAGRQETVLQVGHIERFNTAYEELLQRPIRPKFIQAERIGPFTGRSTDIGVVLDLMIHDLDLLLNLVQAPVSSVEAVGVSIFGAGEDVANARLHFANGCVAEVTASRASPMPSRRTHIWSAEGYARVDYGKRQLTLVQPSEQIREHGLDPRRLDPVSLSRLREDLFTRHFQSLQLDCNSTDQLTRELADFVRSVTTGQPPRVTGEDGLNAIALADRILHSLRSHRWEGHAEGPAGPNQIPVPAGILFQPRSGEAAA